jgi:hypothetical protein
VYPLLHVQLVSTLLPAPEYVCAGHALHVDSEIPAVAVLYLPREHSVQAVDPFTSLYDPVMHAVQVAPSGPVYPLLHVQLVSTLLPAPEYVCAGHALHVDSKCSPVSVEYFPCGQRVHAEEPFTSLYVPATHASHSTPSAPVYPLLHVQLVSTLLPAPEYVCAGHALHAEVLPVAVEYFPCEHKSHSAVPFTVLYVPATHASHSNPSAPVYPLLHVQLVSTLLPAPEYVCAGHALHVTSEIPAVAVLYLPREHSVQAVDPFTSL